MKTQLRMSTHTKKKRTRLLHANSAGKLKCLTILLFAPFAFGSNQSNAQGTWTAVAKAAPHANNSTMIVLSDGTIMCHSGSGGSAQEGTIWDKLTPDIHGSYINGTWTSLAPMKDDRLYFSSNLLKDGRLYLAGGEYGSGKTAAEVYNPLTNVWTSAPNPGGTVSDANSMILEDGKVLQALVTGGLTGTKIYDPKTNTYSAGPTCKGMHNESSWVKLPDNSILFIDRNTKNSERYIPKTNTWVTDATVPASLYDPYGLESGAAFLLPDGRAFFLSSLGQNAYYTPSGTASPGTWQAAPVTPGGQGTPDAPAAMMINGKILCIVSPAPTSSNHFPSPSKFYEFDYLTGSFTLVNAPGGVGSLGGSTFQTNMLDLPDGSVLFSQDGSSKYYIYTPVGAPLAAGKPKIDKINVTNNSGNCAYTITGTGFNGISEGAAYGDDEAMSSNYPLVRLSSETGVYYARTFNWNSTGVMRGSKPDTTQFTLPAGLSATTTYSLVVVANGIASSPVLFVPCVGIITGIEETANSDAHAISVYPNPANTQATVTFNVKDEGNYTLEIVDMIGKTIRQETGRAVVGDNSRLLHLNGIAKGVYTISIAEGENMYKTKILVK